MALSGAASAPTVEMDIDMDLDLGPEPEFESIQVVSVLFCLESWNRLPTNMCRVLGNNSELGNHRRPPHR